MTPEEFAARKRAMSYRKWRMEHLEENRERSRLWNQTHKEAVAEYQRRYYQAHKEAIKEQRRLYYAANKDKFRAYYARQKAKKAALLLQQESGQPENPASQYGSSITREGGKSNAQSDADRI